MVPYGQLLNNTIYGGRPTGTGITVEENASPTLLNNIVANNETAFWSTARPSSTVIGANLFQSNTNDGATGSNAICWRPTLRCLWTRRAATSTWPSAARRSTVR